MRFYAIIIFFLLSKTIYSQYYFEHYNIAEGLSQSIVYCILQDSKGFIWIGTQDGLNKYDGLNFHNYSNVADDTCSISNNWIYSIFEDSKGDIWIGTRRGLNKYDSKTGCFQRFYMTGMDEQSSKSNAIYGICEDNDGDLWINSTQYIYKYNYKKFSFKRYCYNNERIKSILAYNSLPIINTKDDIWFGSDNGLYCFNKKSKSISRIEQINIQNIKSFDNQVNSLFLSNNENLWIGTDDGICCYNIKNKNFKQYLNIKIAGQLNVLSLCMDKKNNLWVGTEGKGLIKIHSESFISKQEEIEVFQYNTNIPASISENTINSLMFDKSDILWAGTNGGGINKCDLKPKKFVLYRNSQVSNPINISSNDIASLFLENKNILWIGTWGNGLNVYNRATGEVKFYSSKCPSNFKISNDYVHEIERMKDGSYWIGTRDGIDIFNISKNKFEPIYEYYSFINNAIFKNVRIYDIFEDNDELVWIASNKGLYKIDRYNESIKGYFSAFYPNLGHNLIYSIEEDKSGFLLIGTENGVSKFDKKNDFFEKIFFEENCSSRKLFIDSEGILWFGVNSGLIKYNFNDKKIKKFTTKNGLANNIIYCLFEDNKKQLWLSTNRGISCFNKINPSFKNYDIKDGLQGMEFNINAGCKSTNGEIFFGGIKGINSFYPDSIFDNPNIPQIVINTFEVLNDNIIREIYINENSTIELSYLDYIFTIGFAGLEFTEPHKNKYKYMLEGFNKSWITTQSNKVTFTNIPPDEYYFKVTGSNNDNIWNKNYATIKIIIKPPWHKTIWAYIGYFLLIIISIYSYIKFREKKLKRDKLLLEKTIEERTIEINNNAKKLEQSNKELDKLSLAVNESANAITVYDIDGTIEFRNKAFTHLYGEILNEVVLMCGENLSLLDPSFEVHKHFRSCVESKQPIIYTQKKSIENADYWIQTTLTPVISNGIVNRMVAIDTDITKIKLAEEKIKIQNEKLEIEKQRAKDRNKKLFDISMLAHKEKEKVLMMSKVVEEKNKHISDSINYALKIQEALIPNVKVVKNYFNDSFVLFKPRDVVSGDFYWIAKVEKQLVITVADCTGHGVPGAFMSMLGMSILKEKVINEYITMPSLILKRLRKEIINVLHQTGTVGEQVDGMDMVLCSINYDDLTLQYAGANNPLYIFPNETNLSGLVEIKPDKMPIAIHQVMSSFTNHETKINKGDAIYLFSDGYLDQFGGDKDKKITSKRFKILLSEIQTLAMEEQKTALEKFLFSWKEDNEQTDDITVLGIKL